MAGKKRERLEVVRDILSLIKNHRNSIRITPLLRQSNLSTERFQEYYSELIEKGFIREISDSEGRLVTLTDKGFRYLERYLMITGFIDEFGL